MVAHHIQTSPLGLEMGIDPNQLTTSKNGGGFFVHEAWWCAIELCYCLLVAIVESETI